MPQKQSDKFVFTINNAGESEDPALILPEHCKYARWQLERAGTGTPHYQGWCWTKKRMTIFAMSRVLRRAHIEICVSWEDADEYVAKEDTRVSGPWQFGSPPKRGARRGARTDLDAIRDRIMCGDRELDIANDSFGTWCRNYHAFERYRRLLTNSARHHLTLAKVYWGPTGLGKTWRAQYEADAEAGDASRVYWLSKCEAGSQVWWDAYDAHPVVVIDEFYSWIPYDMMLRLLDRQPLLVQTKGSFVNFCAKTIYFTSNVNPREWYPKVSEELKTALWRRLYEQGEVTEMTTAWLPPARPAPADAAPSAQPAASATSQLEVLGTDSCEETQQVSIGDEVSNGGELARIVDHLGGYTSDDLLAGDVILAADMLVRRKRPLPRYDSDLEHDDDDVGI